MDSGEKEMPATGIEDESSLKVPVVASTDANVINNLENNRKTVSSTIRRTLTRPFRASGMTKLLRRTLLIIEEQAEREDGQLLILPSVTKEEVGALSDPTPDLSSIAICSITRYGGRSLNFIVCIWFGSRPFRLLPVNASHGEVSLKSRVG